MGSAHWFEILYVFYNTEGSEMGANINPFANASQEVFYVAKLMTRMWVSFIHDLDPNNYGSKLEKNRVLAHHQLLYYGLTTGQHKM